MAVADILFLPWPSWARLSFVLGGLLLIVVFIAATVKAMNWRKLLRLERRVAEDQAERGEIRVQDCASAEPPFGVKALNEGSSIEGVWNARTTTPLHGPTSRNRSPLMSPAKMLRRSKRDTSVSSIPSLDISEPSTPAKPMRTLSDYRRRWSADYTEQVTPLNPPEEPPHQSSATLPTRKKANSITISYSGPSTRPKHVESNAAPETEGLLGGSVPEPVERAAQSGSSPPKLRLGPSFSKSNTKCRKFIIGARTSPSKTPDKPANNDTDVIERMNAHRRLHSAEQGQLIPRVRPHSEDNARVEPEYCNCDERDGSPTRAISWPTNDNVRLSKRTKPKSTITVAPPVVPQTSVADSLPPPKPCPSAWTGRTQEMLEEQLTRNVSMGESIVTPPLCSDATVTTPVTADDPISIENKTPRKINQGFEILPAGSLQKEADLKVIEVWPEALPEVGDRKKPKKLQKRHRRSSSVSSRESRSSSESTRSGRFAFMHAVH